MRLKPQVSKSLEEIIEDTYRASTVTKLKEGDFFELPSYQRLEKTTHEMKEVVN